VQKYSDFIQQSLDKAAKAKSEIPQQTIGVKRPRRQATIGKNYAEDDKDPYVYTSGTVIRGNTHRRKLDDDQSRLESISPTYSA
jgi:hypothetical protein